MQNKNLYYVLGGVVAIGLVYFLTKKKKEDVVVNLNPPMEVDEEKTPTTPNPNNSAVSILDKIKEIIQEVKKKSVATPPLNQ
jgi:LPXTG-motif cell wall-anchored protein